MRSVLLYEGCIPLLLPRLLVDQPMLIEGVRVLCCLTMPGLSKDIRCHANQRGLAIWAVWAAISKYSPNACQMGQTTAQEVYSNALCIAMVIETFSRCCFNE